MYLKALGAYLSVGIGLFFMCSDRNIAGSVTETGNVTGSVIFTDSKAPAAAARVALFKKRTAVLSPGETFAPDIETYTDNKGYFSVDIDDGAYTLLASDEDDTESAFIEYLTPGTDAARGMTVALQKNGTITGEITNALELRESGNVVVRILGTDIFQLVDKTGKFTIDNAPAGALTLVSYATAVPVFSPVYQDVMIAPDSVKDVSAYELYYDGIPIPKDVQISYDDEKQTIEITWHPVADYDDFQEFVILRGVAGNAQHDLKQIAYTADTVYRDRITFSSMDSIRYEYAVRVNNKLGQYGQYYGIYAVATAPYQSAVDAGEDQTVDIGTDVRLTGCIRDPKSPVVTMEWKIGNAPWAASDSGEGNFTTGSSLASDTTVCVFRMTDSLKNVITDTVIIRKEMLITAHGPLPGLLADTNGYPRIAEFKDRFWYISGNATSSYSSWSTADFATWTLENGSCPIANNGDAYGELVSFKNQLFILNIDSNLLGFPQQKSYRSDNGTAWSEITVIPPPLESLKLDSRYTAYDYYHLNSHIIEFHSRLFALLELAPADTQGGSATIMKLVASADGASWECVGTIPGFDYRYSYTLLSCNDRLYFVSIPGGLRYGEQYKHKEVFRSADEGITWENDVLWDTDESTNPDLISFVTASNSIIFACYFENGSVEKESILLNGAWNTLPSGIVEKQQFHATAFWERANLNGWRGLDIPAWLAGSRFYWVEPGYTVKSIKLF